VSVIVRRRPVVVTAAAVLLFAFGLVAALGAGAYAWGDGLRDEQRLLPGTTVAGVDVGGRSIDEAVAEVEADLAAHLDREVTVVDGDRRWTVTPRELGASSDAASVVAAAFERTERASLTELARLRWGGGTIDAAYDVAVGVPPDAVASFVDEVADELDVDPADATVTWAVDGSTVGPSVVGRAVDRDGTIAELTAALDGAADEVTVHVRDVPPAVDTTVAEQVAAAVDDRVASLLDHTVTLRLDGRSWTTTPRALDAVVDAQPTVEAALADGGAPHHLDGLRAEVPEDALASFVARIAGEVDQPARDAQVRWTDGRLQVTAERTGLALDRGAARAALQDALGGDRDLVTLTTSVTRPSVTADSFDRVLYLDQSQRELALIVDGEVARSWPVAVGMGGSPTPTGTFTVGAKRYEPTWYNPAPDRWGADMPAVMGPGPDNPLGPRALNWNRNGRDTLIRFHGTPNEDSIGEAASRGCVRMYNADVIELFDLVPTGTTIISVR
jgi:lipoprotein-anchoring transpeptidase ErfK/SrfK